MKRGAAIVSGVLGAFAAALSAPALTLLIAATVVPVGALCWILADTGRAERLAMLIRATRGTHPPDPDPPE